MRHKHLIHRCAGGICVPAIVLAGACASPPPAAQMPPATPAPDEFPPERYPRVVVADGLKRWVVMSQPVVVPAERGRPMAVRVPIRSIRDSRFAARYRFTFLGPGGEAINPSIAWSETSFLPGAQQILQANSISDRATDWRLEIIRD